MLKIRVDHQEVHDIIVCARSTAALRSKAEEGQHCFILQVVKCRDELEYHSTMAIKSPYQKRQGDDSAHSISLISKGSRFLS